MAQEAVVQMLIKNIIGKTIYIHCKKFQTYPTQNFLVTDYIYIFPLAQLDFWKLNCNNSLLKLAQLEIICWANWEKRSIPTKLLD